MQQHPKFNPENDHREVAARLFRERLVRQVDQSGSSEATKDAEYRSISETSNLRVQVPSKN